MSKDFTNPLQLGHLWQRGCVARGASAGNRARAGLGARTRPCLFKTFCILQSHGLHLAAGTCLWLLWRGSPSLPDLPVP